MIKFFFGDEFMLVYKDYIDMILLDAKEQLTYAFYAYFGMIFVGALITG